MALANDDATAGPAVDGKAAAPVPEVRKAETPLSRAQQLFQQILGFRQEEEEVEFEEKQVEDELKKNGEKLGFAYKARLLNLEAVLKEEDNVIKDEEWDIQAADPSRKAAFAQDVNKLARLEKIESELRFSSEENKELNFLQKLLPK